MSVTYLEDENVYAFQCDECAKVAGFSHDEKQAREDAHKTVDRDGWIWNDAGLYCPECRYLFTDL